MTESKPLPFVVNILRLGVILLIITAAVALVLGFVDLITAGRIEKNEAATMKAAMQTVLPADSYTELSYTGGDPAIDSLYQAGSAGWVVQCTVSGSQGEITLVVGVDSACACTGISVITHSETAGLGAVAAQSNEKGAAFRVQFVGQSGEVAVKQNGGAIDAISGATITSKAVCSAVTSALNACAGQNGAANTAASAQPAANAARSAGPAANTTASAEPAANAATSAEPAAAGTEPAANTAASAQPAAPAANTGASANPAAAPAA